MRVSVVFGTRPEAVKVWSVVSELRRRGTKTLLICTGQHESLLQDILSVLPLDVDENLNIMRQGQRPEYVASEVLRRLPPLLASFKPDWLVVQGDTITTFAAAVAGYLTGIRVAHIEAGLRTYDLQKPFPEEANRRMVGVVATLHFAPTQRAAQNLIAERVPENRISVTGNTVVDALNAVKDRFNEGLLQEIRQVHPWLGRKPFVLLTVHRRESFGKVMRGIFKAVLELAEAFKEMTFVYPVHPNPHVRQAAEILQNHSRILLIEPLNYLHFLAAMSQASLVMTDSGGVQEEAPSFGVPVVVLRDKTEREEAIESGWAVLGTTNPQRIFDEAARILSGGWQKPRTGNPFGDGKASLRIVDELERRYEENR